jgi:hypothetical protein
MSDAINPYRPPPARLADTLAAPAALFSLGQIAGTTFLFSFAAGCWLLARNFSALGNRGAARIAVACGFLLGVGLLSLAVFLPQLVPRSFYLGVVQAGVMYSIASAHQGAAFQTHVAGGGRKRSN